MIKRLSFVMIVALIVFAGCMREEIIPEEMPPVLEVEGENPKTSEDEEVETENPDEQENEEDPLELDLGTLSYEDLVIHMEEKYGQTEAKIFGENIEGVYTHIETEEKIVALTFDACGGRTGSGYDSELIDYLIEEKIPATLFINNRWIRENPQQFKMLTLNDLFEIENHGYEHRPLSVEGKSVYEISGTGSIAEVIAEVMKNQNEIYHMTGVYPRYFRSGTAFYDDVSLSILKDLGIKAVNFNLLGDAGATFNKDQMVSSAKKAKEGSILLYHMNQPEKAVADGIKLVVPMLREKGYRFVRLSDYDEYLR